MTEDIKPSGTHCPKCRAFSTPHRQVLLGEGPWAHCSFCDVDTEAMFGPDALVAVAREVFAICNVEGINGEVVTPEDIVERLTGVKR